MKRILRIFVVLVFCITNLQVVMANAAGVGIGKLHPRLTSVSNLFTTPDAPTNLVATGINTGGLIQFTAPANDGGSSITNYEYSTDNGATWITPSPAITSSPLIISSGLTNCTSYQVKIRAVNANGSGTASAAVSLVPSTSSIGVNWTSRTSAANNSWQSVTYGIVNGNGLFVAVSNTTVSNNQVMTSPDGINWTAYTSAAAANKSWQSVTYGIVNGNGLFVAVSNTAGTSNQVMTSPDGINWTAYTSAADIGWKSVTYGNGLFVAVSNTQGTSNRVMISSDGITWTAWTSAAENSWTSVTYGNGLFVAVASSGTGNRVMTSSDGITWTSQTSAVDNGWRSVTYGNGVFVAVASSGTGDRVMTSENGTLWTSRTSAADLTWNSITYANGMFVAVASTGTGNRVMTSPDGRTWTARTSAADNNWNSITYANGMFVAVASSGARNRVMTSTFNVVANPPVISSVDFRNSRSKVFFTATSSAYAPSTTNYEYSTDDGLTFTALSPASIQSPINIGGLTIGSTYAVRIRAINSVGSSCASSAVSVTPSVGTVPDAPTNLVATGLNTGGLIQFLAPANDGGSAITNYEYSTDNGSTWITPSPALTQSPIIISSGLTNCTSYQVKIRAINAAGSGTESSAVQLIPATSVDMGVNWTQRASAADNDWSSITYGNGLFVAVAQSGTGNRVMTSPDGITWTARTSAADNNWTSVTYGNGLFVAVASSGTGNRVMTSPDGITWTARTSAADNEWVSVTYGNGLFVAVASLSIESSKKVMTSADGITWTILTLLSPPTRMVCVTYANGLFIAVANNGGNYNTIFTSPDGINWASQPSIKSIMTSITYGNGLFIAVTKYAEGKQVYTTTDGITLTQRTIPGINDWTSVTYGDGLFVAVANTGTGDRVMTSPDGITWTSRTSAADNNWSSVTYGNGVFVAVARSGSGNRVMTSSYSSVADAPVITSSSYSSGTAIVNFTQSASSFAPTITNYEYSTDNGSNWVAVSPAATTSPLTITGLATVPTTILIRAVNSVGNSCPSNNFCVPPTAPTASAQTFCGSKTVADLVATGTDLKWYDVATNGTALASTTAIATGTYYVTQTLNSCESNRTSVAVTVNTSSAPTASAQTFCGSKTVADLVATGTDLKWYDVATNGTALASTTAIATGTYYVTQTLNSCETIRTSVIVTVNAATITPTASAQTFLGSKTVADLVATGTDLKWYDVATNGTALASTTAIATGTYYVSQTLNSCESDRTSVSVTVTILYLLGTPTATLTSCSGTSSTPTTFSISGSGLTASVTITAPANFEISTTSGGTYSTTISLDGSLSTFSSTIYARLSSTAPSGTSSGTITASSSGATAAITTISGTVNAPVVLSQSAITICNNGTYLMTASTAFPVSNGWVSNNPAITVNNIGYITAGMTNGSYVVSYTDGCAQTTSATVTVGSTSSVTITDLTAKSNYKFDGSPHGPAEGIVNYIGYNGFTYASQTKPSNTGFYRASRQDGNEAGCPVQFYIIKCDSCQ
jgi:Ig-like domain CHU_C associated